MMLAMLTLLTAQAQMPPGMGGGGGMPEGMDPAMMQQMMGGMGGGGGMGGMGGPGGGMPPGMGGMGGMGGPGGPGGGPPQPPPPPKDFPGGAKKARTMLKELKAAFKTKTALEAFASAPEDPQKRMEALGPQLEGFTSSVVKKYGFDGGFHEAMQSIAAVGGKEQDEKIRGHMEDLGEIITGEKSPGKLKKENEELREKLAACEAGK